MLAITLKFLKRIIPSPLKSSGITNVQAIHTFLNLENLEAIERLGKRKGYSLVGCDSNGVNAFFIRDDCLTQNIDVLSPQLAYQPHQNRLERGFSLEEQFNTIRNMPFVEIEQKGLIKRSTRPLFRLPP